MKKIFNNDMVKHVWAQMSQPYGRNTSGSISFNGGELVSYNTAIALHYGDFVLISDNNFSVTTSQHMPCAWDVKVPVIYCNLFEFGKRYGYSPRDYPKGGQIKKAILEKCFELAKSYAGRRTDSTRQRDLAAIEKELESLRFICERFGLVYPKGYETPTTVLGETETTVKRLQAAEARKNAKAKKAKVAAMEDARHKYECWLNGDIIEFPWQFRDGASYVLTIRGDRVLTSGNAEAPIAHVKRALAIYRRVVASGKAWKKNGQRAKLGFFELDFIDTAGNVKAGCHLFTAEEVKRFINKWGI